MTSTKQNPPTIAVFKDFFAARDHGAKYGKGYSQWRVVKSVFNPELETGYAVRLCDKGSQGVYLSKHGAPIVGL